MNGPSILTRTGILFALSLCAASVGTAAPPNIILYISDDLGRLETSIHGSPDVRTPTLNRLAESGLVFDNAYVASPSCCPNRYSLLTGLMPARHGAHPNHSQPHVGTRYLVPILKQLGYYVASFGKIAHGRSKHPGVDFHSPQPRELHRHVSDFIADHQFAQPLCLMVGDRRPHVPWTGEIDYDPDQVTLPPYLIDTPETRRHWARYLTDITGMDQEMGMILDMVQPVLGDDTLVMFTSDHGGQWPFGKWNLYDAGTRVPLVVSWPGSVPAGNRSDAFVSWVDILPTLIDVAGGEPPRSIDGKSFASVLRAPNADHRSRVFTTHTGDGAMNIFPIRSIREGSFKLIVNLRPDAYHTNHSDRLRKDGAGAYWKSWEQAAQQDRTARAIIDAYYTRPSEEFFDLSTDTLEQNNLIDQAGHQDKIDQLRTRLADWMRSQQDDGQPHRPPYSNSEPLPDLRK